MGICPTPTSTYTTTSSGDAVGERAAFWKPLGDYPNTAYKSGRRRVSMFLLRNFSFLFWKWNIWLDSLVVVRIRGILLILNVPGYQGHSKFKACFVENQFPLLIGTFRPVNQPSVRIFLRLWYIEELALSWHYATNSDNIWWIQSTWADKTLCNGGEAITWSLQKAHAESKGQTLRQKKVPNLGSKRCPLFREHRSQHAPFK